MGIIAALKNDTNICISKTLLISMSLLMRWRTIKGSKQSGYGEAQEVSVMTILHIYLMLQIMSSVPGIQSWHLRSRMPSLKQRLWTNNDKQEEIDDSLVADVMQAMEALHISIEPEDMSGF